MTVKLMKTLAIALAFGGCFSLVGCGGTTKKPGEGHHAGEGHDDHPTEGPHKGHLIELGNEEFHAELAHDEATKTVTVYILDGKAKGAVPVEATEITLNLVADGKQQQVKLPAAPQPGDPTGKSSAFAIINEELLEALESPKTKGRLNVSIKGKDYVGEIEHLGGHDHK